MKKNVEIFERTFRVLGGVVLGFLVPAVNMLLNRRTRKSEEETEEEQDNDYYPVKSDSELAAGHPIVGVS